MSRRSEICFCSAVRRIVLTHTRHEISITSILAPRNTVSKRVKHHFRPLITRTQTCYQINYRVFYRKNIFARNRKLKSKCIQLEHNLCQSFIFIYFITASVISPYFVCYPYFWSKTIRNSAL